MVNYRNILEIISKKNTIKFVNYKYDINIYFYLANWTYWLGIYKRNTNLKKIFVAAKGVFVVLNIIEFFYK